MILVVSVAKMEVAPQPTLVKQRCYRAARMGLLKGGVHRDSASMAP